MTDECPTCGDAHVTDERHAEGLHVCAGCEAKMMKQFTPPKPEYEMTTREMVNKFMNRWSKDHE